MTTEPASRRQPPGLYVVVLTEVWERFSFYGMRALLVLFLIEQYHFSDRAALAVYGSYVGLLYLMPLLGGVVANRLVGFRTGVVAGGVLMGAGHIVLAMEGRAAAWFGAGSQGSEVQFFYLGLALIVVGNGFFKPSLAALLGSLYREDDPRRDGGFTWLVLGVNIGAALAAMTCGYLGQTYGWAYGFGAAGAGMWLGLLTFVAGERFLREPYPMRRSLAARLALTVAVGAALLLATWELVQMQVATGAVLVVGFIGLTVGILWQGRRLGDSSRAVLGLVLLTCAAVPFWAMLDQTASSINLLTSRYVETRILGISFRSSQLLALAPLFALLIGPPLASTWTFLARRRADPGSLFKFGLGLVMLALSFAFLLGGIVAASSDGQMSAGWLVVAYLAHAAGELCISPIGLSAVTASSPRTMVGLLVGYWFMAIALGGFLSGLAAQLYSSPAETPSTIWDFFGLFGWMTIIGLVIGLLLLVLSAIPVVRRKLPLIAPAWSAAREA